MTTTAPPGHGSTSGLLRRAARARLLRLLGLAAALVLIAACSVTIGSRDVGVADILAALGGSTDGFGPAAVAKRIPRTLLALLAGAALGISGAVMQGVTRNPLADPGILGVNAGASFAVTVAVGLLGVRDIRGYMWFAFAGALIVTIMVLALGSTRRGQSPVVMVLAGVAIGAVLGGAGSALQLTNPDAFDQMRSWNAGSILGRPLDLLWPILPFFVLALVLALVVSGPLNAMALGDEVAAAQGVRLMRTRVLSVIALALLAGGATAIAGPIGFVGLMVPHVARWFVGPHQRWIFAYSMLLAPSLLLVSDILGRIVMRPSEIPVGIVTAFVGAPVLIALVRRKKASGL